MPSTVRIAIAGAAGRMGASLIEAAKDFPAVRLSGGLVNKRNEQQAKLEGKPLNANEGSAALFQTDMAGLTQNSDIVIEFTNPSALGAIIELCVETQTGLVSGTTGLDKKDEEKLMQASRHIAIFRARNFSIGIALLAKLAEHAARLLPEEFFDVEIFELHHRNKYDSPSGTALALGEAIARGRGRPHETLRCHHAESSVRKTASIGYSVARGGDVIGEHSIFYLAKGERLELTHRSRSRSVFAQGALRAACWLHNRPAGLYSMEDLLSDEEKLP